MLSPLKKVLFASSLCLWLLGCGSGADQAELREYINDVKSRPPGMIEPIPTFRPYEAFVYAATAKRSPFDRPIEEKQRTFVAANSDLKPDLSREKEYLESFDLGELSMVGTLEREGTLWALINDSSGGIHRVTTGNYLGKNFGRIVQTSKTQLQITEIVSNGLGGWVERPRVLNLSEKE